MVIMKFAMLVSQKIVLVQHFTLVLSTSQLRVAWLLLGKERLYLNGELESESGDGLLPDYLETDQDFYVGRDHAGEFPKTQRDQCIIDVIVYEACDKCSSAYSRIH